MKNGFSLIIVIFVITTLLVLGAVLSRAVLKGLSLAENKISSLQSFYLAEAGIEYAKNELKKNQSWYTDLPHSPQDDIDWVKNQAKGTALTAATGTCRIIREKDQPRIYALGYAKKSLSIVKFEFGPPPLFTLL